MVHIVERVCKRSNPTLQAKHFRDVLSASLRMGEGGGEGAGGGARERARVLGKKGL